MNKSFFRCCSFVGSFSFCLFEGNGPITFSAFILPTLHLQRRESYDEMAEYAAVLHHAFLLLKEVKSSAGRTIGYSCEVPVSGLSLRHRPIKACLLLCLFSVGLKL